ncbi:MAG: hypothetical protein M0R50_06300 [Candidatus Cloacimonetes bacterium]|nr:hypothetical protein [Candidatus Cloacimonadota bacterium]
MKSAGEQSQGQAVLQGLVAQYSQRRISLISCASDKYISISLEYKQLHYKVSIRYLHLFVKNYPPFLTDQIIEGFGSRTCCRVPGQFAVNPVVVIELAGIATGVGG